MNKFNYKTTKNSLLSLFQASPKSTIEYIYQFEQVSSNYDLNNREEFMKLFFQKTSQVSPIKAIS